MDKLCRAIFGQQEDDYLEVDDTKKEINDEHKLDVKWNILMNAIYIWCQKMKKIFYAEFFMGKHIVIEQEIMNWAVLFKFVIFAMRTSECDVIGLSIN